jgi:hypothetical protein
MAEHWRCVYISIKGRLHFDQWFVTGVFGMNLISRHKIALLSQIHAGVQLMKLLAKVSEVLVCDFVSKRI